MQTTTRRILRLSILGVLTVVLLASLPSAQAATINVENLSDAAPGSLRAAMLAAVAGDEIIFEVKGTINLTSALPPIPFDDITINGTTADNYTGVPTVAINGAGAGPGASGITVAPGVDRLTVYGLYIFGFHDDGIQLTSGFGHQIGLERWGPNGTSAGNVIGLNGQNGVNITGAATHTLLRANYIGTAPAQMSQHVPNLTASPKGPSIPNNVTGVQINAGLWHRIGGNGTDQGNVISGNKGNGVNVTGPAANVTLRGNSIGVNLAGDSHPNGADGIQVWNATDTVIGFGRANTTVGSTDQARIPNIIAQNNRHGVEVQGSAAGRNIIRGNMMYNNTGLGIFLRNSTDADLGGTSTPITPNDKWDLDWGPNNRTNFPTILGAEDELVNGRARLNATNSTTYIIDIYGIDARIGLEAHGCDETVTGHRQGMHWISMNTGTAANVLTMITDGLGTTASSPFQEDFDAASDLGRDYSHLVATATPVLPTLGPGVWPVGGTSMFSTCTAITHFDSLHTTTTSSTTTTTSSTTTTGTGTSTATNAQDSDQDGLTDAAEVLLGTDPNKPDTDGDGFTDFAEWQAGSDPLDPTDTPDSTTTNTRRRRGSPGPALLPVLAALGALVWIRRRV